MNNGQHEDGFAEDLFESKAFTLQTSDGMLLVNCDARLETMAQWLLKSVAELGASNGGISDGMTVEIGWAVLTLAKEDDGAYHICEPNYGEDPFESLVDDVTVTMYILTQQQEFSMHTGTAETAQFPLFDETIVLWKGALEAESIYLERGEPSEDEEDGSKDSGWYIGLADEDEVEQDNETVSEDDYEAIYVYELLSRRPVLMQVLGLPAGYSVVFDGDDIDGVYDEDGDDLWNVEDSDDA
jgi:hypothetical protein